MTKTMQIKIAAMAVGAIALLLFWGPGPSAAQRVYIDIDSPAFQRFPVAVADFEELGGGAAKDGLTTGFPDELGRYLDMTGYMRLIPRGAFLEDPKQFTYRSGKVNFPDWTVIGAEYLVKGVFSRRGEASLDAAIRLYDTVRGERILEKSYTGGPGEQREMARRMARDVTQALTGDGSVFDTKIAFVIKKGRSSEIYTINFDGSGLTQVTNYGSVTLSPRWPPDGGSIGFISYKDGNPDLFLRRLEDYRTRKLSNFPGLNLLGGWSPDGRKMLLTLSKDGNEEIYQLDLISGQLKRLTHESAIDVSPVWSPDGRRIAFVSNRSGSPQIFVMDSDGSGVRRLTYEGNYNTSPAWSPHRGRIAYEGSKYGRFRIFTVQEEGGYPVQIGPETGDCESPSWSPDGRYIAFSQRGHGAGKIAVMNANGANVRILYENQGGCMSPAWSPRLKP